MATPEVCVVYVTNTGGSGVQVLLGRKRTGLGAGKVVAPGGKLEPGESPVEAAVRELGEETGIRVSPEQITLLGDVLYLFPTKPEWNQRSWVFLGRGPFGEPTDSAELAAEWIAVDDIPFSEMWGDAVLWLRAALEGDFVPSTFTFGPDLETVVDSTHPEFVRTRRV